MAQIHIIVGSVMGTALEVAQALQQAFSLSGHQARVNPTYQAGQLTADANEVILICTSNTGMGDLPANITPLYEDLTVNFPNIAGRRYGIVNLGDSSYPNFALAGKTLDEALADLGAQRVGETLVLDAIYTSDYAKEVKQWAEHWEKML